MNELEYTHKEAKYILGQKLEAWIESIGTEGEPSWKWQKPCSISRDLQKLKALYEEVLAVPEIEKPQDALEVVNGCAVPPLLYGECDRAGGLSPSIKPCEESSLIVAEDIAILIRVGRWEKILSSYKGAGTESIKLRVAWKKDKDKWNI